VYCRANLSTVDKLTAQCMYAMLQVSIFESLILQQSFIGGEQEKRKVNGCVKKLVGGKV
jgi:hypothetical protein